MESDKNNYWKEKYQKNISLFFKVSEHISPGLEIKEVLPFILETMAEHLDMIRGMITILNRKTSEIVLSVSYGMSEEEQSRGRYQLGEGITGKVVDTGKSMVIQDIGSDPQFLNRTGFVKDDRQRSFICVPVKTTNEVIGSLSVEKLYTDNENLHEEWKIMTIIATMISRAVRLHQALHEERQILIEENERLQERLAQKYHPRNILGNSSIMRHMFEMIHKIARSNSTALILGESGVGKELVAQAIHYSSDRAASPFVTFNCAALPENLIESELFGYGKGAFTGAVTNKPGKFQIADQGTIFLDEVGELSPAAQSKLLRVLQEREFEKLGTNETIKVDVRVIAATNRDLLKRVEEGHFRSDLFYRLNVFPITVPPLRERKSDIPLLVDHFVEKYSSMNGKRITRVSTPAIDMLMAYHWPGNVRELENCIERAVILVEGDTVHGYHLPPSLQVIESFTSEDRGKLQKQLDVLEYELIVEELKRTSGNTKLAAKNLGISYRQFGLRMDKYKINKKKFM